jgi:histidinol-phosphate aminotransferase/threonine-phosphate decarboxylase
MDPDAVDELCSSSGSVDSTPESGGEKRHRTYRTADVRRIGHGGTNDPRILDFGTTVNPRTPAGLAQVYDSTLAAAQSYPADDYSAFRAAAAEYVGCEATEVIPTAGSLAAIRLVVATTVGSGDSALVPYPSFDEYAREVRLQGGNPTFVHHEELLDIDPAEFALVVVCTPNNPTGTAYNPEELRAYADRCRNVGTLLLVDESFIGFTHLDSLAGHEGVVVVRSLSKLFGLPGLRAGFAVATGRYRDRFDATRVTWGLGTPGATVGRYCLQQAGFVTGTRSRVSAERARMRRRLDRRFDVYDSDAPFLLLELGRGDSVDELLSTLREHDITVRDARSFRGLANHIRVNVRLPEENDQLLDALDV